MKRLGHIQLKLTSGHETRAPVHLDVLDGAKRAAGTVDGYGAVDRMIHKHTSGMRCRRCYHAHDSLTAVGARHDCYSDLEQDLGFDRTVAIEIADPVRTDAVVDALRSLPQVEWATVETFATTPLHHSRMAEVLNNTAFTRVGAAAALEIEPGSRNVAVAVIDTGISLGHKEFAGRLRSGYDTVDLGMGYVAGGISLVGDSLGRDFCARDETGHGTHVAGIVGARGLSMPHGVAGQSALIPIRALAAAREGDGPVFGVGGLTDINAAIKTAADMGARVLNMSFGTARTDIDPAAPPPHADVLAYVDAQGCIPVAAMGNSGLYEEYFPAALPECIAVGSMNITGQRSEFSTSGEHIALCAPGEHVFSTGLEGYSESTGTSHAAPFVAGAVALLAARAQSHGHRLSGTEARRALCLSADRDRPANPDTGWGMLNIPAALSMIDQMTFPSQEDLT